MKFGVFQAVFLAWPAVVAILFRVVGPAKAVLVAVLGGFLFLPPGHDRLYLPGLAFAVDKWNMTGLGLIAGVLIFDRRSLAGARPRWVDLPMIAFILSPLTGLAVGDPGSSVAVLDLMVARVLGWLVPYAAGRLYFGKVGGPTSIVIGVTIAGLSYVPICLYEEVVGPDRYLAGLIYGIGYNPGMVARLGGWRPEGFLGNGLSVAAWMGLSAVTATWLWLSGWKPKGRWPAWTPALVLTITCLSCRGVYGDLLMTLGLTAALVSRWTRSRIILALLLVPPVLYMGLRATGAWDGQVLTTIADKLVGRPDTVDFRLRAENELIGRVLDRNATFGFGDYVWNARIAHWPDGAWLHVFWMGGLVGLTLQLVAIHAFPAVLTLARTRVKAGGRLTPGPSWALACWCILELIDGLHNNNTFPATALIAGSLVGFASNRAFDAGLQNLDMPAPKASQKPYALIAAVIVLVAIESLGRWRSTDPADPGRQDPKPAPSEPRT